MTYKCKICGGTVVIDNQNGVMVCEFCGTKQALPLFTENSARLLYERGNNYLLQSEYDKAESMFSQLLTIAPNDPELYWDLVLCKYGVTYVKDPETGKYIPTCNRTHYTPVFKDENYLKAIELSSGEKNALYKADAETIDNIQKGILAVSKKEKPFDIFISYKETDANGNRTKDSIEAQNLYEKLTEAGYKVFFSRITLEDKVGTEYEPYIYAALYSSKVMLAVFSSKENIEAAWVKNEWGRFLSLQQKNADKTLIPLYFDMNKQELPDEFSLIPSFNIKEEGFEAELLRGIKKQIPLPIMLAQKRQTRRKTLKILALCFLAVAVAFLPGAIKNHINGNKYDEAMQLFEEQDYSEAKAVFETIPEYEDAAYMIERCDRQPDYDNAMQLYYYGEYAKSAWAFAAMGDYEDAADMQKKAEASWRKSLATVCADNYYITENGTVSNIKGTDGGKHIKVDITKNGKAVSIIENDIYASYSSYLTVLHENGNVSHPELDNKFADNSECHDIIKISETFRNEIVGLRADGKMVVLFDEYNRLEELSEWENIIDFKENYVPGNGYCSGLIVGLKSDGTLCASKYSDNDDINAMDFPTFDINKIKEIIKSFENVKSFALGQDGNIIALTTDNKLLTYINGEFNETNGSDICDVVTDEVVLKYNGDVVELSSGKVILQDVAYCGTDYIDYSYYAITKSGNIHTIISYEGITANETGSKTMVCDEWISRLS